MKIAKTMLMGIGIVTLLGTVAGAYFLYGSKNALKNRRRVKAWSLKARGEIMEKMEGISEVSEKVYHKIIQEVSDKYKALKNINENEVSEFTKELKGHWKNIAKEFNA